jgi:signal transduction histidine kinase
MPPGGRLPFLVLALRWATVTTGAVVTLANPSRDLGHLGATAALLGYNLWRTLRPFPGLNNAPIGTIALLVDLAIALGAVVASGGWDSPFVFTPLVGVVVAGFTRGYAGGLVAAGFVAVGLALAALAFPSARADPQGAAQVALVYAATAVVAGYARRLFLEGEALQAVFSDRVHRLTEANSLLSQLTRVAQKLPSSLDLGDTLVAAMGHLRQLFDFTGAAILVFDPATGTWRAEAAAGRSAPPPVPTTGLPPPVRAALNRPGTMASCELDPTAGDQGLWPGSRSGLYGPLVARDHLVALVAIEHTEPESFGVREVELLAGLAEPLALAIDNALWFDRLRMLGADGERDRLARNLHDRIGQGLAYVGLELDRLAHVPDPGTDLARLRQDVGGLLGEVRETLRQLRTRVTDAAGLANVAEAHLDRFTERTGIATRFTGASEEARLPVPVEQELWRILLEALSNVERHSQATTVDVKWAADGHRGRLEVRDDGSGFDLMGVESEGASGLVAMRERANAIGARLVIDSEPGRGTIVVADVEVGT